jgi:hypothetical protein
MSLPMKTFLLCLALVTTLVVIAASHPGGAHVLQIKYLQPGWRTPHMDRPLRS